MTDANHVDGKTGKALDFGGVKEEAQHMTIAPLQYWRCLFLRFMGKL